MVSDDFAPAATGVGVHLQIVAQELASRGHRIIIITSRQPGQASCENWNGITVYRFLSLKIAGFWQAIANPFFIRRILKNESIDIVHFHYISSMMVTAFLIAKLLPGASRPKLVYTYHMTEDHLTQPWFMQPFRSLIRKLIVAFSNQMDTVISPSQRLKDAIQELGIKKPTHVLTNPIAAEFYRHQNSEAKPAMSTDPFIILFAGRLNPEKNIPLLLNAFAVHLKSYPDSVLWLAGRGDQEPKLKQLARQLKIESKVQFLGFLKHDELADRYRDCDVFVLPSVVETQGMVAMEAMSFAKPVIVTKEIVSAYELVDHEQSGFVVDAFQFNDLACRLSELASNPQLKIQMGINGQKKINAFNPTVVTEKLEVIYNG